LAQVKLKVLNAYIASVQALIRTLSQSLAVIVKPVRISIYAIIARRSSCIDISFDFSFGEGGSVEMKDSSWIKLEHVCNFVVVTVERMSIRFTQNL